MKQNIWIMNHYAGSMFFNNGGRHFWLSKYLKRMGYDPVVFCANSVHGKNAYHVEHDALWEEKVAETTNVPFVFVKAMAYGKNGVKRIRNMFQYYGNVQRTAKQYAKQHGAPDVIYASSVHPLTLVAGIRLAKYFGVKCICEVRDLWPESIVVYSKKLKRSNPLIKLLYAGEKWIYKKCDRLIFTMAGGPDYIKSQKWDKESGGPIDMDKVVHINNGVDLEAFKQNLVDFQVDDADLDDDTVFKVVYAGSIRRVNNIGLLLDAAKLVKNESIKFIIYGDGDQLPMLKQRVADEDIRNVVFKGRVPKQYVPSIICRADLNVVHCEMTPILKFGDSMNKSFEYFASGKPLLYTVNPNYSLVKKYHCGMVSDAFEPQDIATAIETMAALSPEERAEMGKNSSAVAELYDFRCHAQALADVVEQG